MDLNPQHFILHTTFDFSSLEKEDCKKNIQVFNFFFVNIIYALMMLRTFLLMSDGESPFIEPSRWELNCCYNHRASFSQPSFFVFEGLRHNPRRLVFRLLVIQPLLTVDFHSFIVIFPYRRIAKDPVNSYFNHLSLVMMGAQLLKFSMVPISVGFLHHSQLLILLLSILTCKHKNGKFPDVFGVSIVNCKFDVVSLLPVAPLQNHSSMSSLYRHCNGKNT